jgi:hypothetical protein
LAASDNKTAKKSEAVMLDATSQASLEMSPVYLHHSCPSLNVDRVQTGQHVKTLKTTTQVKRLNIEPSTPP